MPLQVKPRLLALLCAAAASGAGGALLLMRALPAATPPAATVQQVQAMPAAPLAPSPAPAFSTAQIDQWVAPVALFPDPLLSQVLMAATYPASVVQAVQWSHDNPTLQGDAAIAAVANQPWDASVKSLVAFPQLMALMGENSQWVQSLGDAFLAQPQAVMDSVQKLRALAQQTGALKTTPQQTVTAVAKPSPPATPATPARAAPSDSPAPATTTIIKIEPADPQVVYIPSYNPATVYDSWANKAYPPVYLPPPPGQQFTQSFARGLGYSLGVATTYALFSSIDWDDDDDHHHHYDDDDHHSHHGDNININVNNYNRITGERLSENNRVWQHNPAYRSGVPYADPHVAQRFHQTQSPVGLSATAAPASRDAQRQAALQTLRQPSGAQVNAPGAARDAQRQAASQKLHQIAQRDSYRGYDERPHSGNRPAAAHREAVKPLHHPDAQQQQRREAIKQHQSQPGAILRQRSQSPSYVNALSGNDSRSPDWQAQRLRGEQSRHLLNSEHHEALRERASGHHELRHH